VAVPSAGTVSSLIYFDLLASRWCGTTTQNCLYPSNFAPIQAQDARLFQRTGLLLQPEIKSLLTQFTPARD
jgi:hypothetical protein